MGMMINRRRAYGGKSLPYDDRFVDLGLPSGNLWAKGNIIKDGDGNYGIGEPTDGGCYFSWGNIDGHNAGDGYSFSLANYNSSPGASLTGNISDNDAVHNAACAILGGGATMPSIADFQELFNANNTTNVWTTVNGVNGRLITSVRNGRSIFLPAMGFWYDRTLTEIGLMGIYRSNVYLDTTSTLNYRFKSTNENTSSEGGKRVGLPIRSIKSNN